MAKPATKDVEFCRQRAEDFRRLAAQEINFEIKQEYLDREARWLRLALSYEFPEGIADYNAHVICTEDQNNGIR